MSALDLLQDLSWLLYLVVFGAVALRTARRPTRAHVNTTLFFGATTIVVVLTTLTTRLHLGEHLALVTDISGAAAIALGYLLLRLVEDFGDVPHVLKRLVELGLVLAVAAIVLAPDPAPAWLSLALVTYIAVVLAYDTVAFVGYAAISRGVTMRRMQAAAAGSLCLALAIVTAGLEVALTDTASLWQFIGAAIGLLSGIAYFIAFAPPTWLRRAWQEPELRHFLSVAVSLPRLPETASIVHEVERYAADALGAPAAAVSLWDPDSGKLRVFLSGSPAAEQGPTLVHNPALAPATVYEFDPEKRPVSGRAFLEQRAILVSDAPRLDPENSSTFARFGLRAALSAPITAGDRRLGVLVVYAPRSPVFANSDLELVQLLADQAAVILESRALIDEAARVRAREEAARLKEDFLSSAAHDLKTPLTGLLAQAQLLLRRADRAPQEPVDRAGLNRLLEQSRRLRDLVLELLDAARLERGSLVGDREPTDLPALVRLVVGREPEWSRVSVEVETDEPMIVALDVVRFEQMLTNLIENALKYSPRDSTVDVRLSARPGVAVVSIVDRGIGVPIDDQPLIFERFHRARNVDDRRFAGMGLGLFIARGIVEQHDGRIGVVSTPAEGSTFTVTLPRVLAELQSLPSKPAAVIEERLASA